MKRLFSPAETAVCMPIIRDFIVAEFGEENCSSLDHWRDCYEKGYHLRQAYGDFSSEVPVVLGMATAILISHAELEAMKRGERRDTELTAWQASDGPAVVWIASVVSDEIGVAARCISGLIDQLEKHPGRNAIDMVAVFCTGPQGYLMSEAFGLVQNGVDYQDGWPFMERRITVEELKTIGPTLQRVWTMTKARDVVTNARRVWGFDWRGHRLQARDLGR